MARGRSAMMRRLTSAREPRSRASGSTSGSPRMAATSNTLPIAQEGSPFSIRRRRPREIPARFARSAAVNRCSSRVMRMVWPKRASASRPYRDTNRQTASTTATSLHKRTSNVLPGLYTKRRDQPSSILARSASCRCGRWWRLNDEVIGNVDHPLVKLIHNHLQGISVASLHFLNLGAKSTFYFRGANIHATART